MIGDKNLMGVSLAQTLTHPGQAHFAIAGATKHCKDCWFWSPKRQGDKKAVCGKAVEMQRGIRPHAVPAYATICQYFTKDAPSPDGE